MSIIHEDFEVKQEPMDAEDEAKGISRRSTQLKGKGQDDDPDREGLHSTSPNLEKLIHEDIGQFYVHLAAHQKAKQEAYNGRKERERMKKENLSPLKESITNNYGWAYKQTILIRPTIDIYFKNMPLRHVGFR
jgi:hypothetical protein